jgi:Family of unknown function (DUF6090)
MAENEIAKHIDAAYKAAKQPNTHWLHRLKEVLIEILIIVFAVTISIWFHNWSDSLHEQREAKEFLRGLKVDLKEDIAQAKEDSAFYTMQLSRFRYFLRVGNGDTLSADSMKAYQSALYSNTSLEPHISRYEGLKGSGKFGIIENTDLLNNIINLHEATIKHVELLDGYYTDFANRLGSFFQENGQLNKNGSSVTNAQELVQMPRMRFLDMYGISFISQNVLQANDSCIVQCQKLIDQIDEELK